METAHHQASAEEEIKIVAGVRSSRASSSAGLSSTDGARATRTTPSPRTSPLRRRAATTPSPRTSPLRRGAGAPRRRLGRRGQISSHAAALGLGILLGAYASNMLTLLYDLERRIVGEAGGTLPGGTLPGGTLPGGNLTGPGGGERGAAAPEELRDSNATEPSVESLRGELDPGGWNGESFVFPSTEYRIKYYMGDWYGRALEPGDVPCDGIKEHNKLVRSDVPVLWDGPTLGSFVRSNNDWKTRAYLQNLDSVLKEGASGPSDNELRVVLIIGDSHSKDDRMPAVAKSRFSKFAVSKKDGKPFFDSIIWPLSMTRHYEGVEEYATLQKEGKVTKWEDKKETLVWRGGVTGLRNDKPLVKGYPDGGWRVHVVRAHFRTNTTDVDVAFEAGNPSLKTDAKKHGVKDLVRSTDTSMRDQLRFKYLLAIEGNDVATGLKWQLASDSVVFMARPTCVTYAMEDMLVPFVHYVPLKDDYSDLVEMVRWARENDGKCRWISEQATKFMEDLWMSEKAQRAHELIKKELGAAYRRQFGRALGKCAWGDNPPKESAVDPKKAAALAMEIKGAGLARTCHKIVALGAYEYEMCIFGKATQWDNVTRKTNVIGNWDTADADKKGHRILRWIGGDRCGKGPQRSAVATITCGYNGTKIVEVNEPTTCHYLFRLESPLGCTAFGDLFIKNLQR